MELYSLLTRAVTGLLSPFLPEKLHRNLTIYLITLPRDLKSFCTRLKILFLLILHLNIIKSTAVSLLETVVKRHPEKACLLFEDQVWTFKEVDDYANKIAQIFLRAGLKKGDKASLLMTNRPEYPCIWMGLAKIGVVTAFINYNLKNKPLAHCIMTSSSKVVIYSADLIDSVAEVQESLPEGTRYFQLGTTEVTSSLGANSLDQLLDTVQPVPPPKLDISIKDHLIYIFTSGTTGLPKAAVIPQYKYVTVARLAWPLLGGRSDDIVYDPLPLYHYSGGMLGVGAALALGATVVIRPKFSASAYIPECIKYRCTVAQYIGEMCRYLLAGPKKSSDTLHNIRMMVGNGLKPAIWKVFVKRFKIPIVREAYASTEGNIQFCNTDNTVGAVGFIPRFSLFFRSSGVLLRVDKETLQPIRGPDGFCIECDIDEPGMLIGFIDKKNVTTNFNGYTDETETKKKYIYDVFRKGDIAFQSGDILSMDELGYLYFKDRTGDTFRWKGENVSTTEVEDAISTIVELRDCVVYGVQVGDLEGKAGMTAIVDPDGQIDLAKLPAELDRVLPKYAQPIFIRILKEVELTSTFKLKKGNLVKEGYDPSVVKDSLYFRNGSCYLPLTKEIYSKIVTGEIRV